MANPRELAVPFRHRDFRILFTAQFASELGDWGARLALTLLVLDRTGSAGLAATITAVSFLPWAVAGPFLATLGDRFPRRSVMVAADVARAALFSVALLPVPVWTLFVAVVAAALFTPPFEAARSAVLVESVPDADYGPAAAAVSVTGDAGVALGYAAGGVFVAAAGASGALAVNIVTFVVSALVLLGLRAGRDPQSPPPAGRVRAGWAAVSGDLLVKRATVVAVVGTGPAFAAQAVMPIWATVTLGWGPGTVGALGAAAAAVTGLGGAFAPHTGTAHSLLRAQALFVAVGGLVGAAAFAGTGSPALAFVAIAGTGIVFVSFVPGQPVIGRRLPTAVRSSAFGVVQSATIAGQAGCAAAAGFVADQFGPAVTLTATMAVAAVCGLWACARPVVAAPSVSFVAVPAPDVPFEQTAGR